MHDVENARACGWSAAHLNKASDLLQNAGHDHYSGECFATVFQDRLPWQNDYSNIVEFFPAMRCAFGLVANRLFGSAFVSYAPQSDFNGNPSVAGYSTLGPHLLALSLWLQRQAQQRAIPTIHFVARDGYLPKQAFDLLNTTSTRSNYIRLSRRALLLADVESVEDLYSIASKFNYSTCTPHKLGEYLAPIIPAEKHATLDALFAAHNLPAEQMFQTMQEYELCLKLLIENAVDLSLLSAYQEQLRAYFAASIHPGDYLFDVGYNGRAEAALSHLLGFPVGSLYLHVNTEVAEKRQTKYHCPCACFHDCTPAITGMMREHLIMELGPSTIGYAEQNGSFSPVLEPYREEYSSALITRVFQNAALDYVRDFERVFGAFKQEMALHEQALSAPHEYYLRYSKPFDREMFASLQFEDSLGMGDAVGAVTVWTQWTDDLDACWKATLSTLPEGLQDLYTDGLLAKLFIKANRISNRLFPKGGRKRAVLKKLTGIFLH
jgi:hypothetical protein